MSPSGNAPAKTEEVVLTPDARHIEGQVVLSMATEEERGLAKECAELNDKLLASTDQDGMMHVRKADFDRFFDLYLQLWGPKSESMQHNNTTTTRSTQTNLKSTKARPQPQPQPQQAQPQPQSQAQPQPQATAAQQTALQQAYQALQRQIIRLQSRTAACNQREAQLAQRAQCLQAREERCAATEAYLALQLDTKALAQKHAHIFQQGWEAAYGPAFESGRRAAVPVAYKTHVAALEEVAKRVKEMRAELGRLLATGGLTSALEGLEKVVDEMVEKTRRAGKGGGGVGELEMWDMAVDEGKKGEVGGMMAMAGVDPAPKGEAQGVEVDMGVDGGPTVYAVAVEECIKRQRQGKGGKDGQ
ncbi:hypothetical protein VTK56DRAFT_6483 [Thermocarpiscus australiensis]